MGVNSAHPLENPSAFTNLLEMISLLLIPAALCFTFGRSVKNKKQGVAIFLAMFICLVIALGCVAASEQIATPQLAQDGVNMTTVDQAGGNMEGKESRHMGHVHNGGLQRLRQLHARQLHASGRHGANAADAAR
jgi:K+-transporting ATPase ATPase A chain